MVKLKPGGNVSRFTEEVKKKVSYKKNSSKKGIATAFTPGFLKHNTRNDSAREKLLKIYHHAVTACGFMFGATRTRKPVTWKVTCSPSTSFEVQLSLDNDMSVVDVQERPLSWVHGTIACGVPHIFIEDLMCISDVRLQIATTEQVKEDSDLYKAVCPEVNGKRILPIAIKDGKPIMSPVFAKRTRQLVNTVRHIQTLQMYTNGSVDASVVYGDCYFGKDFVLNRPFCELSLYFDPANLIECIDDSLNEELLRALVSEHFECSLLIQEALEKALVGN